MLSPFLLIGVGGSGGKTLRTARADLERQLNDVGWTESFPDAWQFVHIDVPTKPDGMDPGLPGALPAGSYQGLVAAGVNYKVVDRLLTQSINPTLDLEATAGWRPLASQVAVPIDRGAGQYRAIGRIITVTHLGEIKSAIEDAVARLQTAEVKSQLMRLATLLGADDKQDMRDPVYLIVSSIAGGSGAGAVVDVSWALRAAGVSVDHAGVILYAPDVFNSIPENMRKGVRPNALATLSELSAGWWNEEGISDTATALYSAEGLVLPQAEGRSPGMILVGRKNSSNLDYVDQNAVYTAMGRALSAWITSESLQDHLTAYVTGNGPQNSFGTTGQFPTALDHQPPPFRAIGYARVSLGRNLFREYASQYLARSGVEVALRKHLEMKRGEDDDRSDRELVEEAAGLAFQGFLHMCGLNERGREDNDVLNALAPQNRVDLYNTLQANIHAQIQPAIGQGRDVNAIRTFIRSAAEDFSTQYWADERAGQLEQAKDWCNSIQDQIMAAVANSVARSGAMVTKEMLARLTREEIPFVIEELRSEAGDNARWANDIESAVAGALQSAGNSNLQANNPLINDAVRAAADALYSRSEVRIRELAIDLLSDLSGNFLEPLTLGLDAARQRLTEDEAPKGAVPSEISMWPVGDSVPSRLQPSPNEFLLEDPITFPATLKDLIRRSVERMSGGDAEAEVVGQVISGASELGRDDQKLVSTHRRWAPRHAELRSPAQAPQRAQFVVALRGHELHDRALKWSTDRTKVMGRYLDQSLADYLSEDSAEPEVIAKRLQKFEGQFAAAVGAAAPLAAIDTKMLTQVHNEREAPVNHIFSTIPFTGSSEARDCVIRVLTNAGLDPSKMPYADSETGNIDVFTALTSTLQPVVFESLMRPIASEWATAKLSPESRSGFWRWRRARPLPEFIPVAPPIRRAMVRGWFTASLLNRLQLTEGQAMSVFDPADRGFAQFPYPLLQSDTSLPYELLPAALKSIPLAWLECSTQGSLEPMRAYVCLRDLGGSGDADSMGDYILNRSLQHWLSTGETPPGAPSVDEAGSTPPERREYALARITKWQRAYGEVFAITAAGQDPHKAPRAFEMRDDIEGAFKELQAGIEAAQAFDAAKDAFN